jgi:hypothetical protein
MSYDTKIRERSLEQVLRDLGILEESDEQQVAQNLEEDVYTDTAEENKLHTEQELHEQHPEEKEIEQRQKVRSLTHALIVLSQYVNEDVLLNILKTIDIKLILNDIERTYPELSKILELILKAYGIASE